MIISPSHSSKNLVFIFYDKLSFNNHPLRSTPTFMKNTPIQNFKNTDVTFQKPHENTNATVLCYRLYYLSSLLNRLPAKSTSPLHRNIRSSIMSYILSTIVISLIKNVPYYLLFVTNIFLSLSSGTL